MKSYKEKRKIKRCVYQSKNKEVSEEFGRKMNHDVVERWKVAEE